MVDRCRFRTIIRRSGVEPGFLHHLFLSGESAPFDPRRPDVDAHGDTRRNQVPRHGRDQPQPVAFAEGMAHRPSPVRIFSADWPCSGLRVAVRQVQADAGKHGQIRVRRRRSNGRHLLACGAARRIFI